MFGKCRPTWAMAPLPSLLKLGRAHVDDPLQQRARGHHRARATARWRRSWSDLHNLENSQGGVLFQSQASDPMQLSNIKVSQWKGDDQPSWPPPPTRTPTRLR